SVDPKLRGPHEESMNFGGFDRGKRPDWRAIVLHEFGHALGFKHEHQHPTEGCNSDFRWEDDPDYQPTTDIRGQYIQNKNGRRPGIYTWAAGPPNYWPKRMVDHNMRQLPQSHMYKTTAFDAQSIMKYSFPVWMFARGENSPCFSAGTNKELSKMDVA